MNDALKNKLVVFLGSFDPPHLSHARCLQLVDSFFEDSLIVCVPSGTPPAVISYSKNISTPFEHRFKMCEQMLSGLEKKKQNPNHFIVSDFEQVSDRRPSYSFYTIEHLLKKHGHERAFLLSGLDLMSHLPNWHKAEPLIKNLDFFVVDRAILNDGTTSGPQKKIEATFEAMGQKVTWIPLPSKEGLTPLKSLQIQPAGATLHLCLEGKTALSSSQIRKDVDKNQNYLHPEIYHYIKALRLYA